MLILRVPARSPAIFYGLLAVSFCSLAWAATRRVRAIPAGAVLGIAVVLRLICLPMPPTLSNDVYRYVWDGTVAAAAYNPYAIAPEDARLAPLRDDLFDRFARHDVATVSPPLALTLFAIVSRLPGSVWMLKAALAAVDILTCAILLQLAARFELPRGRVLWYAWNPLATLEIAGMGHIDALGVCAAVAAVWFLSSRPPRALAGASAAAAGVLAKLVPVVALPLWAKQSRQSARFLLWVGVLCGVALAPVLYGSGGVPPGLVRYGVDRQFNGPLFEPLWRVLDAIHVAPWIKAGLVQLKHGTGWTGWNAVYPYVYPELLAKGLLVIAVLVGIIWHRRHGNILTGTGGTFSWLMLASAAVYPWYLVWVLPFAALCRQPAWLLLSATVLFAYLPHLLHVPAWPWMWLAVWLPFGLTLLRQPRWSIG